MADTLSVHELGIRGINSTFPEERHGSLWLLGGKTVVKVPVC